jgi:hypothetical protein
MLHNWVRVFKSVSGTLTDISLANQKEDVLMNIAEADFILIGKQYPTNNFFFANSVVNDVASNMVIEYWGSNKWYQMVDVLDDTSDGSKTLSKSGVVQFTPQEKFNWGIVSNTTQTNAPSELSGIEITNLYWLKISFSAALKSTSRINRITYLFTDSQTLKNIDVSINDYLASFGTGKTDWTNEIIVGSLHVVKDLQSRGLIVNEGEVLRFDDVSLPTAYMTLSLIYSNLGTSYKENRDYYAEMYRKTISISRFSFDTNSNARLERNEISTRTGVLAR